MRLVKILIGEILLLFASIFIFRSVWTLLDQYLGYSYLLEMLIAGVALTVAGLIVVNHEVKCGIRDMKKAETSEKR